MYQKLKILTIYRFSHKDFGLRSHIKIRPQRTIVRLRIILIWRFAKIFMTKPVSGAYPFTISNYPMIIAITYQRLYDFKREWKFTLYENIGS